MNDVILYYAHPGHQHSGANAKMQQQARTVDGVSMVDLYSEYPRFNIDIDKEQQRLLNHDKIVFQFPVFWYSSPAIIKEWLDLVLEYGFAYGTGGDKLQGKTMQLALTAAGSQQAYSETGYQHHSLRTFFTPFQQTAVLCQMRFLPPYVLFDSLQTDNDHIDKHATGFASLLAALRDSRHNPDSSISQIEAKDLSQLIPTHNTTIGEQS